MSIAMYFDVMKHSSIYKRVDLVIIEKLWDESQTSDKNWEGIRPNVFVWRRCYWDALLNAWEFSPQRKKNWMSMWHRSYWNCIKVFICWLLHIKHLPCFTNLIFRDRSTRTGSTMWGWRSKSKTSKAYLKYHFYGYEIFWFAQLTLMYLLYSSLIFLNLN